MATGVWDGFTSMHARYEALRMDKIRNERHKQGCLGRKGTSSASERAINQLFIAVSLDQISG